MCKRATKRTCESQGKAGNSNLALLKVTVFQIRRLLHREGLLAKHCRRNGEAAVLEMQEQLAQAESNTALSRAALH
jgi:hypothetical protein